MSKWTNAYLTADGQNLQAQLLDGGGFEFTKVTAADASGADKLTLTIQPSVIDGKTITVPVLLSNSNLSTGFTMNQLKFYARKTGIPAGDEIVYAIAEDEAGDDIPSESDSPGFTIDWSYTFQFGNATSVNVSIDPAGLVSTALLGKAGGIATLNSAGAVPIEQGGTGAKTAADALAALGGMKATATGEDIPTSDTDETSISSQLSNRLRLPIAIPATADLNDYVSPGMYFCSANAQNVANIPPDSITGAFSLLVEYSGAYGNGCKQTFTEHNPGITYIRRMSDISAGHWSAWEPISTATPPEGYNLPLSDGISVQEGLTAIYSKDQFGRVVVHGDLVGQMQNGSVIATLPAGFRPIYTLEMPATCDFTAGRIQVNSAGEIRVIPQLSECSSLCFLAVFVAGG